MEEAKRTKIHPRRTWAIAARWFQLSRNFQFRVAFERTSKFRERERERKNLTRSTSRWGNPFPLLDSESWTSARAVDFAGSLLIKSDLRVIPEKKLSSSRRCWITRDSNARARGCRGENRAVSTSENVAQCDPNKRERRRRNVVKVAR